MNGHLNIVEFFYNQKNIRINFEYFITSPLHLASENGHLNIVEYLINQKAKIDPKNYDILCFSLKKLLFI